jgi:DnaK suppressor protein
MKKTKKKAAVRKQTQKKTQKKKVSVRAAKSKTFKKIKKVKDIKTQEVKVKKPKSSLRDEQLQGMKKNLIKQKEVILTEAEDALNLLPGQMMFPDTGDQASAEVDRNFMLRLRGREQKLLKKIEDAIERIDNGTFGICESCGMDIDVRRLEARPVTTFCINCKTLQEEEEKLKES